MTSEEKAAKRRADDEWAQAEARRLVPVIAPDILDKLEMFAKSFRASPEDHAKFAADPYAPAIERLLMGVSRATIGDAKAKELELHWLLSAASVLLVRAERLSREAAEWPEAK